MAPSQIALDKLFFRFANQGSFITDASLACYAKDKRFLLAVFRPSDLHVIPSFFKSCREFNISVRVWYGGLSRVHTLAFDEPSIILLTDHLNKVDLALLSEGKIKAETGATPSQIHQLLTNEPWSFPFDVHAGGVVTVGSCYLDCCLNYKNHFLNCIDEVVVSDMQGNVSNLSAFELAENSNCCILEVHINLKKRVSQFSCVLSYHCQGAKETPGANVPWDYINSLLIPAERFLYETPTEKKYMIAPAQPENLKRVMNYFYMRGNLPDNVLISTRNFKRELEVNLEDKSIKVGTGTLLHELKDELLRHGLVGGFEEPVWTQFPISVGDLIQSDRTLGVCFQQKSQWYYSVKCINNEGSKGAFGVPYAVRFIVALKPQAELYFVFQHSDRGILRRELDRLSMLSSKWERLDLVLPGDLQLKGTLLAKISGTQDEIDLIKSSCEYDLDGYGIFSKMKRFLFNQSGEPTRCQFEDTFAHLKAKHYIWYHHLTKEFWKFTGRD